MNSLWIDCSIRALLIAGAVASALWAVRIRSAAGRHAAWTAVVAAMLMLPAMIAWGPKASLPILPAPPQLFTALALEAPAASPITRAAPVPALPSAPSRRPAVPAGVVIYLAGVLVMSTRLAAGTLHARRLVKTVHQEDGFLSSDRCATALTVGWFRPVVVLPAQWRDWTAGELDAVLAHEREHARRRDPLVEWAAMLNRAIFWFHPIAWWLKHKLTELAEDACDAAAIARGHDRRDYAGYLIGQARAVGVAGGRVRVWGAAMTGSSLERRVRRILEGRAPGAVSRGRSFAAATVCAIAMFAFAACKLDRAEKPLAGQPTMNELMHRRADDSSNKVKQTTEFIAAAKAMTPDEVKALEAKVQTSPEDHDSRKKLLTYYQYKPDYAARDRHLLWLVEHDPLNPALLWPFVNPQPDEEVFTRGKPILLAKIADPSAPADLFARTAGFVSARDPKLAEEILLKRIAAEPGNRRWSSELGRLYADGVVGTVKDATFAGEARKKLSESNDAATLISAAQMVAFQGTFATQQERLQLAQEYLERARSLAPADPSLRGASWNIQQVRMANPANTDAASQMYRLQSKMLIACYGGHDDDAAQIAHDLLKLAEQTPDTPMSGDSIFAAKMTLGKVALHRGDKREAVRQMLDAAETKNADVLLHRQVPMELARSLVDWGERSAVADFLEKCAKVNDRGKELSDWAAEIRKGINPDLKPMMTGCSKEPC